MGEHGMTAEHRAADAHGPVWPDGLDSTKGSTDAPASAMSKGRESCCAPEETADSPHVSKLAGLDDSG